MKKILHTNYTFDYGGIQEIIRLLVIFLPNYEHYVVGEKSGSMLEDFLKVNANVCILQKNQIANYAKENSIDIVISHTVNGSPICEHQHIYDLRSLDIKIIGYLHCAFQCQSPLDIFDAIITESESNWKILNKEKNINVIPFGIDIDTISNLYSGDKFKKYNNPNPDYLIGRISRLEDSKLISETIKAMALIKQITKKPIKFVIAGTEATYVSDSYGKGNYITGLKKLAKYLELEEDITFIGQVSLQEKIQLLSEIDIYLAPSSLEGYGLVFCEAMANGIPVVSYDHYANKETISKGGIVVEYGNINKLVDAVTNLVEKPLKIEEIGRKGRELVSIRNSPKVYANKVNTVIQSVLKKAHNKKSYIQ